MSTILKRILGVMMWGVPASVLERLVRIAITLKVERLPAEAGLRTLLRLDNFLYQETGQLAVRYDGGHHAKQRLTGYVAQFADLAATIDGPYLDVGCSSGELTRAVAARTAQRVVGIDIVPERIAIAESHPDQPNLEYVVGDAMEMELDERFRTVILSNVYEHIADRSRFLRNIVTRHHPSHLLIRVPTFERDWRVALKRELGIEWRLDTTHEIEHTLEEFEQEMSQAGLHIVRQDIRWGEIWALVRVVR